MENASAVTDMNKCYEVLDGTKSLATEIGVAIADVEAGTKTATYVSDGTYNEVTSARHKVAGFPKAWHNGLPLATAFLTVDETV